MFQITINEKGGQATSQSFDKNEITIGRVQGNDVVLPKGNISKRHSRIVLKDGKFIIVDLKSTNGTYVNGKKITAPQVIKATDKIYIGDYTLQLSNGAGLASSAEVAAPSARPKSGRSDEIDLFGGDAAPEDAAPAASSPKAGSPGLIDDNFDQEFDAPPEPQPKAAKPAPQAAKGKPAPQKTPDPEPPEPDLDADLEGDPELDLGPEPGPEEEPEPPADLDDEPEAEEPEPPKAPVVPIAAKAAKKPGVPAPTPGPAPSRGSGSRRPPVSTPPPQKGKASPSEEPEDDLFDDDKSAEAPMPPRPEPAIARPGPAAAAAPAREAPAPSSPPAPAPAPQRDAPAPIVLHPAASVPAPSMLPPVAAVADRQPAIQAIHLAVVDELGLRGSDLASLSPLRDQVLAAARAHAQRFQSSGRLSASEDLQLVAKEVVSRAADVDLIASLYKDDGVVQIVITHDRQVWAEREALKPEPSLEPTEAQIIDLIRCLGVLGGANPGPDAPLVDVRLRDGTRVVGVLPPLAFRGPTLSIRKATRDAYNLESFVEAGTLSEEMARFLEICLRSKKNILLLLGPGVSGSATLNALASTFAEEERVVTIEQGVELHVQHLKNVVALEPSEKMPISALLRHAMALHPEHVLLGSLGGAGTCEVLVGFSGPLDGSVATYFSASASEALDRLAHVDLAEKFPGLPAAAKRLVASAFPIVVQETRFPEGGLRRITAISELVVEGEEVQVQDVFVFRPESLDDNGVLNGSFAPTGHEPRFVQELVDRGDPIDMDMFKE